MSFGGLIFFPLSFKGNYNSHVRSPDAERRTQSGTPPTNNNGFLHSRGPFSQLDGIQQMGSVGPPDDPSGVSYPTYEGDGDFHGLEQGHHPAGYVDNSPEFYPQPSLLDNKYPPSHYSKNVSRGEFPLRFLNFLKITRNLLNVVFHFEFLSIFLL